MSSSSVNPRASEAARRAGEPARSASEPAQPASEAAQPASATVPGLAGRKLASVSVLPALIGLLVAAILYSVTIGRYDLSMRDVAYILIDNVHPLVTPYWDPVQEVVVEQVRLPRIMAAVIVGFGLAISGAALQGLFRNPLVDPGIIGVTSGAGFGGTPAPAGDDRPGAGIGMRTPGSR